MSTEKTTGDEPHDATAIRDALERERRDRELVEAVRKELETRKTTMNQPLASLNVVVKHDMPPDELWVHPVMFDLLQRAFIEADAWRQIEGLAEMKEIPHGL